MYINTHTNTYITSEGNEHDRIYIASPSVLKCWFVIWWNCKLVEQPLKHGILKEGERERVS